MIGNLTAIKELSWEFSKRILFIVNVKNWSASVTGWPGSRVVSMLDSGAERPGFKSQSRCCRVTVLGKLFTPIVPLFTKQQIGNSPLKDCGGNCRPGGK